MKIIIILFIIVILGLGGLYFTRNILVESAVEEGSDYALGVETDLGSAGLNLSGGSLELNNYTIPNPDGFEGDNFLTLRHAFLDVEEGSILDDDIVIDSLVIEGVKLSLEQIDAKGNYKVLLDHINKLNIKSSSESQQTMYIKNVAVRDISVDAVLTILGNEVKTKTFTVDNFSMKNIGGDDGATIGEVTAEIVKKIIAKASTSNQNILSGVNLDSYKAKASDALEDVKTEAVDKLKDLGSSLTGKK